LFVFFFPHHRVALVVPHDSGTTSHMIEVPLRSKGTFGMALLEWLFEWLFEWLLVCCSKKAEIDVKLTCCSHV
jgi:hypothetical protein